MDRAGSLGGRLALQQCLPSPCLPQHLPEHLSSNPHPPHFLGQCQIQDAGLATDFLEMSEATALLVDIRILKSQLGRPAAKRLEIPLNNCAMAMAIMLNSECCQRVMSCLLKESSQLRQYSRLLKKQKTAVALLLVIWMQIEYLTRHL